jgi:crossover junction endodeoxyribonuclease RuvC
MQKVIMGIDPGTTIMGYGVISISDKKIRLISSGAIQLNKYDNHAIRLKRIFERTLSLIEEYHPDELAIEAPFFGKNVQSMLKLGRAQGVALAAALYRSVPVIEYSPKKIKQSITGNGNATKLQVASMLQRLLQFENLPKHLDATDGLAAAVCHHFQNGKILKTNVASVFTHAGKKRLDKKNGWKLFAEENKQRIIFNS